MPAAIAGKPPLDTWRCYAVPDIHSPNETTVHQIEACYRAAMAHRFQVVKSDDALKCFAEHVRLAQQAGIDMLAAAERDGDGLIRKRMEEVVSVLEMAITALNK